MQWQDTQSDEIIGSGLELNQCIVSRSTLLMARLPVAA
jgi:hypothetical protein